MMEEDESQSKLNNIIEVLQEAKDKGVSAQEILEDIRQYLPSKVVYKTPEPQTSPERLQYLKEYRELQKKYNQIKDKENKEKIYNEKKIANALLRTRILCPDCKKVVFVEPKNNYHTFKKKRIQKETYIQVWNSCPHCQKKISAFGGKLYKK